jgi:hypothetical protein
VTRKEATQVVAMLQGAFPQRQLPDSTVEVYAMALADLDFELAKAAVMRLVQTSRFLPTVAEIREAAVRDRVSLPTPEEAWGIVRRAIGKHGSYRVPVFDCDEVHDAVRDIGWQEICLSETPASTRARFIDAFKSRVARRMDQEARGSYVRGARELPALPENFGDDTRCLVETGYASGPAVPLLAASAPALPALNVAADEVLESLVAALTQETPP